MAFHNGTLPIVTDGLKYCIDGADTHCYNGSGTSVTNLTSNTIGGGDFGGDLGGEAEVEPAVPDSVEDL